MTLQPFPLTPKPSYYATCSQTARNCCWYVGDTVIITLSQATPTGYYVLDFFGNIVATGSVSSTTVNLGSSWVPGWYRVYFTGSSSDALFGPSYGVTNFAVVKTHANFATLPASVGGFFGGYVPSGTGETNTQASTGVSPNNFGSPVEMITNACLGIGTGRLTMIGTGPPLNPSPTPNSSYQDTLSNNSAFATNVLGPWWLNPSNSSYAETVRTRRQWISFPRYGYAFDALILPQQGHPTNTWAAVVTKDTSVDGSKTFVGMVAGTTGGTKKIQVYYPDASTLVETYDNILADGSNIEAAINGVSNYILVAPYLLITPQTADFAPTAIGNGAQTAVATVVSTLYPLGVTHFEGPFNEPPLDTQSGKVWALYMKAFARNVHLGNAAAKAIGPSAVDITSLAGWEFYLASGGGANSDCISFHDYNTSVNGDINQARNNIEAFQALLATHGLQDKELWQTEATHSLTMNGTIFNPRRARVALHRWMIWEQYGIPRERNPYWYSWSAGFWAYPSFMYCAYGGDKSPLPQVVLMNVMAQETFGKNHHHRIDFGSVPANRVFFGSLYGDPLGGSVAVMCCASAMPSSTVTLNVTGTSSAITVVSGLGVTSTVTPSGGKITVDVLEIPTYVRLPPGVTVDVDSVRDWGATPNPSLSSTAITTALGGSLAPAIADDAFFNVYTGSSTSTGIAFSSSSLPDTAEMKFGQTDTIDRVLVFAGPCYQAMPGLVTYTVDTWDGSSWTTRVTVSKTAPTSFWHGADGSNTGTTRETYWDEQSIEDIQLSPPVACKGVRVNVSATTYGGQPDNAAQLLATGYGASTATPKLVIQEIMALSATAFSAGGAYNSVVEAHGSLVGYWRLGEPSGTTAASEVNTPTLDGTYSADAIPGHAGLITGTNKAVSLASGSTPHVTVAHNALLNLADVFTIEFWINPATIPAGLNTVVSKSGNAYNVSTQAGVIKLMGPASTLVCSSSVTMVAGTTYHVMVTKNGATSRIYVNGVDVTTAGTNATFSNTSNALTFGVAAGTIHAILDEVAIYSTALSSSDALAHYLAGIAPQPPVNATAPSLVGAS